MTQMKSAGASRRGRRLVLNTGALLTVGVSLLLVIGRGNAEEELGSWQLGVDEYTRSDAEIATHLLESVRGANAVVCAAIDRTFDSGHWGRSSQLLEPITEAAQAASETAQWIGKRRLDEAVLTVARPGLSSADECTRGLRARWNRVRAHRHKRRSCSSPATAH